MEEKKKEEMTPEERKALSRARSNANLLKSEHKLTVEEARKGGKKSALIRQAKKTFHDLIVENFDEDRRNKLLQAMEKEALSGNVRAFELLRDTAGEKPVDKNVNIEMQIDNLETLI